MITERISMRLPLLLALLLLGSAATVALAEEGSPKRKPKKIERDDNDLVPIAGRVVDKAGQPIANLSVVLEVTRVAFSLRQMQDETKDLLKLPGKTDADGRFRFDWTWQRHYNHFELAVGFEVNIGQTPGFETALRRDISKEVRNSDPGNLTLMIEERGYLDWLGRMLGGRATEDELKLFREQGRPGRVDDYGDGRSAWWYFEAGKVYRLSSGTLGGVEHFAPIPPAVQ